MMSTTWSACSGVNSGSLPVANGVSSVGPVALDKFLLVITAEADSAPTTHAGPTVLHGTSPSGWLQSFLTHPLFRGISQ